MLRTFNSLAVLLAEFMAVNRLDLRREAEELPEVKIRKYMHTYAGLKRRYQKASCSFGACFGVELANCSIPTPRVGLIACCIALRGMGRPTLSRLGSRRFQWLCCTVLLKYVR